LTSQSDEEVILVHVPTLVAVLINAEEKKGSALTQQEVLDIRDSSQCIAMPIDVAEKVADERGYSDIDPENAWNEWQNIRLELASGT
jgi:hypothetical protein